MAYMAYGRKWPCLWPQKAAHGRIWQCNESLLRLLVASLGPLGTSGTIFAAWQFVDFEHSGKRGRFAAEERRFPALPFLCDLVFVPEIGRHSGESEHIAAEG